jgi:hypothetical protein
MTGIDTNLEYYLDNIKNMDGDEDYDKINYNASSFIINN